jgi:hypothetical protein
VLPLLVFDGPFDQQLYRKHKHVCVCVNGSHSAPQCVAYRGSARQVNKNKTKDIQGRAMASVSELVGRLSSAYILLDWLAAACCGSSGFRASGWNMIVSLLYTRLDSVRLSKLVSILSSTSETAYNNCVAKVVAEQSILWLLGERKSKLKGKKDGKSRWGPPQ